MDIKLKSKKSILIWFLVSIYLLAIASIACIDVLNHRRYLKKEPYLNSDEFRDDVYEYFQDIEKLINEYESKPKEKNSKNQIKLEKVVNENRSFRYYVKNKKTQQVYSNINTETNINDYIKNNTLVNIDFSKIDLKEGYFNYIDSWAKENNFLGNIVFVKREIKNSFNHMRKEFVESNKSMYIKEIIIGSISFAIGTFLILYLLKYKTDEIQFIEKIREKYNKIPIELRVILLFAFLKMMCDYQKVICIFEMPITFGKFIQLTIIALYIFCLLICGLNFMKNKDNEKDQWENSIINRIKQNIKESAKIKSKKKIIRQIYFISTIIVMLYIFYTTLFGWPVLEEEIVLFSTMYLFIYVCVSYHFILKKTAMLNKIVKGTEEMVVGNLDYSIDENDKGLLGKLAYNINNMKKGFKKSVESRVKSERLKTELITNVSHDLKTPLTSIINYVDLLKSEDLSKEDMNAYIQILDKKSKRLKVLIEDLFEASKISSGSIELNIEKVDISEILRQALGEFYEKIEKSSLDFKVNIEKDGIYANLDGKKTWRVFENLIGNILKYSMNNSRVYIDLKTEENKAVVTMKNISAYEMDFDVEEIFERFKRADKARKSEGSGLGLAIAKSIVELQGANMDIVIDGDLFKVTTKFNLLEE